MTTKAEFTTEFVDPAKAEVDANAIAFNEADAALAAAKDAKEVARRAWEQSKEDLQIIREARDAIYGT